MDQMPIDLILHIFSFMETPLELITCGSVCQPWQALHLDASLWKNYCKSVLVLLVEDSIDLSLLCKVIKKKESIVKVHLPTFSMDPQALFGKGRSPYQLFATEHGRVLSTQFSEMTFKEIGKVLSKLWDELPPSRKQIYEQLAAEISLQLQKERMDYEEKRGREAKEFINKLVFVPDLLPTILMHFRNSHKSNSSNTNYDKEEVQNKEEVAGKWKDYFNLKKKQLQELRHVLEQYSKTVHVYSSSDSDSSDDSD